MMKLRRVSGKEIIDNHFNIILISSYSIILAVVYGYWLYVCDFKTIFTVLAAVGFILFGLLFSWLSTIKSGNKIKQAEVDNQNNNVVEEEKVTEEK